MMDRPQASETIPADHKKTHRLYPSLPNVDRYDVYVPKRSIEQKLQTAMEFNPECLLEDSQSDVSAVNCDVSMKAQMLILQEQRQELLSINEKWAKEYRTIVQYYKEKVRDLKVLMQQNRSHFEAKMCKTEDGDASSELLKAKEEVKALQAQNNILTRRGQHQEEEIKRLNKALEEALQTTQPLDCSETLQDLWKHQAEVYKEDFLKERKDREKLKDKYLELKQTFIKVHNELRVFKSQATWTPPQPVPKCTSTNQANQHHVKLQRRCTLDKKL